jgi:nicotinamidase/pyrazinamidase
MGNIQNNNKIKPEISRLVKPLGMMDKKFILGIIDPQNDFFRGGSLSVTDANDVIGPINKLRFMLYDYMDTFISQDFHPPDHMSFAITHNAKEYSVHKLDLVVANNKVLTVEQTLWPTHCVQDTNGCNFHDDLIILKKDKIFKKGTKTNIESYSAFGDEFSNQYENTGLKAWLNNNKITDIILVGIATDYCVYNTAKDAIRLGYRVHLILSCTRGVAPDSTKKALDDLVLKNVKFYSNIQDFINENQHELKPSD